MWSSRGNGSFSERSATVAEEELRIDYGRAKGVIAGFAAQHGELWMREALSPTAARNGVNWFTGTGLMVWP